MDIDNLDEEQDKNRKLDKYKILIIYFVFHVMINIMVK